MPMDDPEEGNAMLSSRFRYDVFLSFRGTDTGHGILDRLHRELVLSGARAFRGADEEGVERGEETAPGLLEAIDDSAAAVAVISENYAASRRCLEELARAVEHGKLLLPLFYDVSPSHVRRQGGPFEQGFREHEARYGAEKVRQWRIAMGKAGGISGWESKSWFMVHLLGRQQENSWLEV